MLEFFSVARLMLRFACPGAFAWKVKVNTEPLPEMPGYLKEVIEEMG